MKPSPSAPTLLVPTTFLALGLSACGGGGGGGEDAMPGGGTVIGTSPTIGLTAPAASGVTDATSLTVRGIARPGTSPVAEVTLNDVPATVDDVLETWSLQVPLKSGTNTFRISARGEDGIPASLVPGVAIERVTPILMRPSAVAVDTQRDHLYVGDTTRAEVYLLDPDSGVRKLLSGPTQGSGPSFTGVYDLEYDAVGDRLLLLDTGLSAIFEISLKTGDRRIVAADDTVGAPTLKITTAIAMIPGTDELLYVSFASGLSKVDLTTGKLRLISKDEPTLGPDIISPKGVAYDPATQTAYVVNASSDVLEVDLDTGKRTMLSDDGVASGPSIFPAAGCELSPVHGLVVLSQARALVSVSLTDGSRTLLSGILSGDTVGSGPAFSGTRLFAFDGDRIFAPDTNLGGVWRVDATTGDRELTGRESVGAGAAMTLLTAIAVDEEGDVVGAHSDFSEGSIVEIGRVGGLRATISSEAVGAGPELTGPLSLDVNRLTRELLVVDQTRDLFVINPFSGDRQVLAPGEDGPANPTGAVWVSGSATELVVLDDSSHSLFLHDRISGETTPIGEEIPGSDYLATHSDSDRVVVASRREVFSVELSSGVMTTIYSEGQSGGIDEPDKIRSIAVDGPRGRVFYYDEDLNHVGEIDLETGQRAVVSSDERGSGPPLSRLRSLAVSDNGLTLYAFDTGLRGLLAISTQTGDRIVFSR